MSFAIHTPITLPLPKRRAPGTRKEGVMTNGAAQIQLNDTETLVVTEESPLLVSEKGEKGDKGDRGKKGNPGKAGPKVLTWSKEIPLHDEVTSLVVFPHDGSEYNLSKLEIVVEGKGPVTFSLVEKQTGEKLATIDSTLTEDLTVLSDENIVSPASGLTALTLEASTGDHETPIKFLALTVTLNK
jgi:hypothetical protein